MHLFTCDNCGHVVYFDSNQCVQCGYRLGYDLNREQMHAVAADNITGWNLATQPTSDIRLRANAALDICNWIVGVNDNHDFCTSCRHNRLVPTTGTAEGLARWRRMSQAQRHLFYSLLRWNLPHPDRTEDPQGGLLF